MASEPTRQPQGTPGVVHIVRQSPSRLTPASVFLVSSGGKMDGVGAFYLGKASGYDVLAALLEKVGVQPADVDIAFQLLSAQPHHEIHNVPLTQDVIRKLGLAETRDARSQGNAGKASEN